MLVRLNAHNILVSCVDIHVALAFCLVKTVNFDVLSIEINGSHMQSRIITYWSIVSVKSCLRLPINAAISHKYFFNWIAKWFLHNPNVNSYFRGKVNRNRQ